MHFGERLLPEIPEPLRDLESINHCHSSIFQTVPSSEHYTIYDEGLQLSPVHAT